MHTIYIYLEDTYDKVPRITLAHGYRVKVTRFKIKSKTWYMEFNLNTNEITRGTIKLKKKEITPSGCFK